MLKVWYEKARSKWWRTRQAQTFEHVQSWERRQRWRKMVVNLNKEYKRRKQMVLWILGFLKDKTPTVDLPLWNFQRPRFVEDLNHVIVSVGVVPRQIVTLGMRLPDVAPDTTSWNSHVLCPLQLSGFHSPLRWKQTYATLTPSHISVQPPTTNIVEFANKPFYTSLMYRRCKVAPTSWWLPFQCRTRLLTYNLNRSLRSSMVVWAVRSLDWTGRQLSTAKLAWNLGTWHRLMHVYGLLSMLCSGLRKKKWLRWHAGQDLCPTSVWGASNLCGLMGWTKGHSPVAHSQHSSQF